MPDFYRAAPGETAPPIPDGLTLGNGTAEMRVVHHRDSRTRVSSGTDML